MHNLKFYYLFTLLITCISCIPEKKQIVDLNQVNFSTTDESELYFKNIRESYYHIEEKDGIKVYRLKSYDELENYYFRPIIIYNWRSDQAFVMLETNGNIDLSEGLTFSYQNQDHFTSINNIKDHLEIVNKIDNLLKKEETIELLVNGQKVTLFNTIFEKSYFSLVSYDFYKLTNTF